MVCISELRGLQEFQARHPETVVVAMNILESDAAKNAIQKLVTKQKLENLRIVEWRAVAKEISIAGTNSSDAGYARWRGTCDPRFRNA